MLVLRTFGRRRYCDWRSLMRRGTLRKHSSTPTRDATGSGRAMWGHATVGTIRDLRPRGIDSGHRGPRPSGALRASNSAVLPNCRTPTVNWRRERDSNPRRAFDPYTLSRGAPSTTRPSLRPEAIKAGLSITYKLDEPRSPAWRARNDTRRGQKGKADSTGVGMRSAAQAEETRASRWRCWKIQAEANSVDSLRCSPC